MKIKPQANYLPKKINTSMTGIFVFALIVTFSGLKLALPENKVGNFSENNSQSQINFSNASLKNGRYQAVGHYTSPGGPETILVDIQVENGTVTDADVESQATRAVSKRYQREFVNNFKPMVIGKNIAELQLDKVAGSSLTPKGFNEAIQKILSGS